LDAIRDEVKRWEGAYVMVIHPDQFQVENQLFDDVLDRFSLSAVDFDQRLLQELLLQQCEQGGSQCLDLLPAFKEAGSEGGLYLIRNTHYNKAGNQLAADEITRYLLDERMLDESVAVAVPASASTSGAIME
jgi:hypothetical protein